MSFAAALPGRCLIHRGSPVRSGAHHRMEPEPALVMRRSSRLVLRADLHQRRVDIDHQRRAAVTVGPQQLAHRCGRAQKRRGAALAQAREGAVQRRVRRHVAEQLPLSTQMLDVGARLPAAGQHQQRMDQHRAPVMNRGPLAAWGHRTRQRLGQPDPVREPAQSEQPHTPHHTIPAACQTRVCDTAKFHLGDAPLNSRMRSSQTHIVAGQRGLSADPDNPVRPTRE